MRGGVDPSTPDRIATRPSLSGKPTSERVLGELPSTPPVWYQDTPESRTRPLNRGSRGSVPGLRRSTSLDPSRTRVTSLRGRRTGVARSPESRAPET